MADFETIPQDAIDRLHANPEFAPQFDTVFGAGRAAQLIAAQAGIPEPKEADDEWSVIGETFRALGGGVRDAVQESGNAIQSGAETAGNYLTGGHDLYWTEEKGFEWLSQDEVNSGAYTIPNWQTNDLIGDDGLLSLPEVADNKTLVGGMGRGIVQFTAGYIGFGKLTGLKGLKGAFLNGALADAIVFDPSDPNITKVLENYDIDLGLFGDALATDPDSPEYFNRLRNAAEGALAGAIVEGIGYGVRAARALKAGDEAGAAEFTEQQNEVLKALDEEIDVLEAGVRSDVDETLTLARDLFGDLDNTVLGEVDQKYFDELQNGNPEEGVPTAISPVTSKSLYQRATQLPDEVEAAAMADGGPLEQVNLSDLRTTQPFVTGDGSMTEGPIKVVRIDGELVILDGNHRAHAAIEAGEATISARVTDVPSTAPRAANDNAPLRAPDEPTQLDLGNVDVDGQVRMDADVIPPVPPVQAAPGSKAAPARKVFMTPEAVEKARMQAQLAAGATPATKQAMFSFRSLTTMGDFSEVLDEISGAAAHMADEFTKIKGGNVQRWSTVERQSAAKLREMAKMTGEDPKALVRKFMAADMGDMTKMAAEIHARSRFILTVEKDLKEMAQAITTGAFDPNRWVGIKDLDHLKLAFNQRREVGAQLLAGQDALRSNVARAMNAMKMSVKGDDKLQAMLRDPALFKDIETAARAVADPANAGQSAIKTLEDTMGKLHGYMDRVNSFRINALLSGPGTQEVNIVSNLLNSFMVPTGQFAGAAMVGDRKLMVHAVRQFQGSFAGMRDSVGTALQTGWWDDAVLDPFNGKIEDDSLRGVITGVSSVDKVLSAPSRALMTMDEFFKQASYRGRIFADASWEAGEKGLKGDEKAAYIKQKLKDSYDDKGAATNGEALLQAQRTTFTEALEPGSFGATIQNNAVKHPIARFVVPFVRTPINILSQTLQHAPGLGFASKRLRDDLKAGGVRAAQARGRQAIGLALTTMAVTMAALEDENGNRMITGSGPSNPAVRRAWMKNNQPYSFRITKEDGTVEFFSYARLEPLSNIFSIAADYIEISDDIYNESSKTPMAQAMLISVMENSVNKTFTQGIYDAMSLMVGRPHEREAATRQFVASFVPNILNQTNGDDTLRETRTIMDALLAKTHLYNGVDPKRNVLGEPVVRTLAKYDPLGLTESDRREIDVVMQEMTRVGIANQTTIGNPATRVTGPSLIDLSTIPFSDTQSVYDRWIELTGTVEIGGKNLREQLEQTIRSPSYQRAPLGGVGSIGTNKGTIIQRVVSNYRNKARGELPELQEIIRAERRLGASNNRAQADANRASLFPQSTQPLAPRPRTFEDLLGR